MSAEGSVKGSKDLKGLACGVCNYNLLTVKQLRKPPHVPDIGLTISDTFHINNREQHDERLPGKTVSILTNNAEFTLHAFSTDFHRAELFLKIADKSPNSEANRHSVPRVTIATCEFS